MTTRKKPSGNSQRRRARQRALQCLYAIEIGESTIDAILDDPIFPAQQSKSGREFVKLLLTQTVEHQEELDNYVQNQAKNWDINRLASTDRLLLRMAVCELLYFPDISPKVTINEALEISKSFSTENSSRFINGILDGVLKELVQTKKIFKAGRGAWEPKKDKKTTE
jgi:transcription antitermination protein NusB